MLGHICKNSYTIQIIGDKENEVKSLIGDKRNGLGYQIRLERERIVRYGIRPTGWIY